MNTPLTISYLRQPYHRWRLPLIVAIKELVLGRHVNRLLALGTGAIVKTAFLFCAGLALVSFGFVPSAVLVTLGVMQLYTALMGGVAAFGLQMAKKQIA